MTHLRVVAADLARRAHLGAEVVVRLLVVPLVYGVRRLVGNCK